MFKKELFVGSLVHISIGVLISIIVDGDIY